MTAIERHQQEERISDRRERQAAADSTEAVIVIQLQGGAICVFKDDHNGTFLRHVDSGLELVVLKDKLKGRKYAKFPGIVVDGVVQVGSE